MSAFERLNSRDRRPRLDWPAIRHAIDLEATAIHLLGEPAKQVGRRPAWHCPFHDDDNPSFTVDEKGWRCWACGVGGDAADLFMRVNRVSFPEAVRALAEWSGLSTATGDPARAPWPGRPEAAERPTRTSRPRYVPPADVAEGLTADEARAIAKEAEERLWSPAGGPAREYLRTHRGLRDEMIRGYRLGWAPKLMLPTADGIRYWRAEGIIIPWYEDQGRLSKLNIRQPDGRRPRYVQAFTDRPAIFPHPASIHPGWPLIVVEGEFDAMLLGQELAGIANVITTGGAGSRPDAVAGSQTWGCSRCFAAHDADESGDRAALSWSRSAVRVRPPAGKDWTDAWRAGIDLRGWWLTVGRAVEPDSDSIETGPIGVGLESPSYGGDRARQGCRI